GGAVEGGGGEGFAASLTSRDGRPVASNGTNEAVCPAAARWPPAWAEPSHDAAASCPGSESRSAHPPTRTPLPWLAVADNRWIAPAETTDSHSALPSHWRCSAPSPNKTPGPVHAGPEASGDSPAAKPARARTACCDPTGTPFAGTRWPPHACGFAFGPSF